MVKWYHKSLPSLRCGFDSRYPLQGYFHNSRQILLVRFERKQTGKALSLLRAGEINAIPKQKETKGSSKADVLADIDIEGLTVEEIADQIGKTVRGVKTMLTRRGLTCSDYNGAAKKEIG